MAAVPFPEPHQQLKRTPGLSEISYRRFGIALTVSRLRFCEADRVPGSTPCMDQEGRSAKETGAALSQRTADQELSP